MTEPQLPDGLARPQHGVQGESVVWLGFWFGLFAAAAGVVAGIAQMWQRREVDCPSGKQWPPGETEFVCYSHPRWELGLGIVALSALGIVLLAFGTVAARAGLRYLGSTGD